MMYGFELGIANLLAQSHLARCRAELGKADIQRGQHQNPAGPVIDVEAREVPDVLPLPAPDGEKP